MTITAQPQTDRPDPSVIAAQNDATRERSRRMAWFRGGRDPGRDRVLENWSLWGGLRLPIRGRDPGQSCYHHARFDHHTGARLV